MNRMLDNIKDDVAFDNGFVNWDDFKSELSKRPNVEMNRFDTIIDKVVSQYTKGVENYYKDVDTTVTCTSCGHINIKS